VPNNPSSFCLELENLRVGSTAAEIRKQRIFTPDAVNITIQNYSLA
jgi:hypothetical protein